MVLFLWEGGGGRKRAFGIAQPLGVRMSSKSFFQYMYHIISCSGTLANSRGLGSTKVDLTAYKA